MYICKNYISTENLKYYILLMGLGNTGWLTLAMARMEDRQSGNLVLVPREVRHHSSELKN
jgi:hypothetical protein